MVRVNFDKDLRYGKRGESFILSRIKSKYPKAYIVNGYCKGYDIVVPEQKITVECKLDRLSKTTGNLAIEYEDKGEPSGIASSLADYWGLIFYGEDAWRWALIDKNKLNWICGQGRQVGGGDGKQARMYLIGVSSFMFLHDSFLC